MCRRRKTGNSGTGNGGRHDTILQMSRELTSINAARQSDTERFIANIEEVARFTVNRRELDRILRKQFIHQ
ncbi:MAG: hypothetical protein LBD93_00910 [Treponema sp.]|nr:hypothetical protein [Treponema sp.]